ncbi:unnamed protein product [Alopecurus aequalis]
MSWPWDSKAAVDERFYAQEHAEFTVARADTWRGPGFNVTALAGGPDVMHAQTADLGNGNLRSLVLLDPKSHGRIAAVKESRLDTTGQKQWEAFRGGDTGETDRLFVAVDRTCFFQVGNTVHVFLHGSSGTGDRVPDFVVKGSYYLGTMTVSRGSGGGDFVAQIRKESSLGASQYGDNSYTVWIHREVDQAFVLALAIILDQMLSPAYDPRSCGHECKY